MFNSILDLPTPVTVRPIGMLGGGGASSKDGPGSEGHHTRSSAHSQRAFTSSKAASPPPVASSSAATPTSVSAAGDVETPLNRPTITIFTELDDEAEAEATPQWVSGSDYLNSNSHNGYHVERGATNIFRDPSSGLGQRQQSALAQTETALSPLHYRSICANPNGDETGMSSSSFDRVAIGASSTSPQPQTTEGSGEDRVSLSSPQPTPYAMSPTASHGPPQQPQTVAASAWTSMEGSTAPDPHPMRLSATPVVPIVPHVAEPSCRRRVADDLERLYGPNGRQSATSTATAEAGVATAGVDTAVPSSLSPETATSTAGADGSASLVNTAAPHPVETPKKKKSGVSFLGASSSSKKAEKAAKAAAAAEAKRKAAPPTAAERRQAREQVIRVGVQRLYQRLNELHLVVYHVKNDGNCQFRAISHQLFGNESYHDIIRSQIVSYMRAARAECFDFYFESPAQADAYYDNLAKPGSWGDELSLRAASDCLYVNIHVLSSEEKNCYITYRPSIERAASAPSFLIDIAKLQERRRAERRLLRSHGLQGPSSSMASFDPTSPGPGAGASRRGGDFSGFGGASTMPDTYGRGRYSVTSTAANTVAPTLLMPGGRGGMASRGAPSMPQGSRPMSREPSGHIFDGDDDDGEVDANAIQLALHKKLQLSAIRCSMPIAGAGACSLGAAAGSLCQATGPPSMPLLQPQRLMPGSSACAPPPMLSDSPSTLLQPIAAAAPVPRLVSGDEDASQSAKANQVERFRAVGAEVQPLGDATQAVNIFTQHVENVPAGAANSDEYVRLRQTSSCAGERHGTPPPMLTQASSRPTLLRPQMSNFAEGTSAFSQGRQTSLLTASSAPYMSPQPQRPQEEAGEMMLLASNVHRGRPNPSLHQSFTYMQSANSFGGYAGGSANAESFNAHPLQGSFSQSFAGGGGHGGSCAQSLGSLVPVPAGGSGSFPYGGPDMGNGGASMDAHGGPVGFFRFEPRTEPIDVFLSYLYPVHYNSLSVSQQQQQQQEPAAEEAMNASTASTVHNASLSLAPHNSGAASTNFLRSATELPP